MRLLHLLLATALFTSLAASAAEAQLMKRPAPDVAALAALGLVEHRLPHGDRERAVLTLAPGNAAQPAPVIVLLHGGSQSMRRQFGPQAGGSLEWLAVARANNVLLLAPNGTNAETGDGLGDTQFWNDLRSGAGVRTTAVDDVGFILALIDWAKDKHRIDPSRIYVTGASNGGMMTFRLLIEAPERFAAGAAFIASMPTDLARVKSPARPTALMILHGTVDPLVRYDGGEILGNRGRLVSAEETIVWWTRANKATLAASTSASLPDTDPSDGCRIARADHPAQAGGAPVVVYTATGGGHAIPSAKHRIPDTILVRRFIGPVCRDAEGADLAWAFMKDKRR